MEQQWRHVYGSKVKIQLDHSYKVLSSVQAKMLHFLSVYPSTHYSYMYLPSYLCPFLPSSLHSFLSFLLVYVYLSSFLPICLFSSSFFLLTCYCIYPHLKDYLYKFCKYLAHLKEKVQWNHYDALKIMQVFQEWRQK